MPTCAFTHPRSLPLLGQMAAARALTAQGISDIKTLATGTALPVPGRPTAVHTPGHTDGHCTLHLPDRDTVLSGDALIAFDPYTGQAGPQIVATAATKDADQALASLEAVAATRATTVLPGHGQPWTQGAAAAARLTLQAGEH